MKSTCIRSTYWNIMAFCSLSRQHDYSAKTFAYRKSLANSSKVWDIFSSLYVFNASVDGSFVQLIFSSQLIGFWTHTSFIEVSSKQTATKWRFVLLMHEHFVTFDPYNLSSIYLFICFLFIVKRIRGSIQYHGFVIYKFDPTSVLSI